MSLFGQANNIPILGYVWKSFGQFVQGMYDYSGFLSSSALGRSLRVLRPKTSRNFLVVP
jgi:hypothetical protein